MILCNIESGGKGNAAVMYAKKMNADVRRTRRMERIK